MPMRPSRATSRQRYRPQRAGAFIHKHLITARPIACLSRSTPSSRPSPLPFSSVTSRQHLRYQLRQQRRDLSRQQQQRAARGMVTQLLCHGLLRKAQRIALYLPADGEIDPIPLLHWLRRCHISVYVPVLRPLITPGLWFVKLTPETQLVRNKFNLLEPSLGKHAHRVERCPAWALDIVLMPLVGFDTQGARLGMGGGYYDRTFSRIRRGKRPRLIGIAHDVQEVVRLPTESWDVPLDMVVTGTRCLHPSPQRPLE